MLAEQFPSNVYAWRELARRKGGEVVTLQRPPDGDWSAAILARLDERVAITALPHCHWTDGGLIDLVSVAARCREVGSALVIDATQSLGALPLDLAAIRPGFLGLRRLQVAARALQPRLSLRRAPLAGRAAARAQLDRAHRQRGFRRAGRLSGRLSARRAPLRRRRAGQLRPDARRHRRARAAAALGPAGDHRDPGGAHCGHRRARECLGPARAAGAAAGRAFLGAAASRRRARRACPSGWQRSVSMSACAAIRCA